MEYLKEEEKEKTEVEKRDKETQVSKGKEIGPDEKEVELNVIDKPQEAWIPINTEPDRNDIMKKLLTIGKYTSEIYIIPTFFFRKEADALGCTCAAIGFYFG